MGCPSNIRNASGRKGDRGPARAVGGRGVLPRVETHPEGEHTVVRLHVRWGGGCTGRSSAKPTPAQIQTENPRRLRPGLFTVHKPKTSAPRPIH
eukprot:scaffold20424_cov70-Isochrysis_galbana.AAC.1